MPNTVISGPVPAYSNVPIHSEYYQPSVYVISALGLGIFTTVTTSINHNYVIGQLVRLLIPNGFGSRGLNEKLTFVLSIPAPNQIITDICSIGIDPFINANLATMAQVVAVGDQNLGAINANGPQQVQTFVNGSFINISPL